ncbi:hypothetical protein niasHT_026711 [Heterodera trifolii]|uniref:Uncharacterized protein n=1 Tax=Heterodera trifolii TaxID=157864 RepID=A0ABD2JNG6_9BILA
MEESMHALVKLSKIMPIKEEVLEIPCHAWWSELAKFGINKDMWLDETTWPMLPIGLRQAKSIVEEKDQD